jgi:hypothetical protein
MAQDDLMCTYFKTFQALTIRTPMGERVDPVPFNWKIYGPKNSAHGKVIGAGTLTPERTSQLLLIVAAFGPECV